jgi:hypothetical protein
MNSTLLAFLRSEGRTISPLAAIASRSAAVITLPVISSSFEFEPIASNTAADGAEFDGIDGLRDYLLTKRREAFVRQFCRKLLGYSLGRAVQLSDGPLLTEMRSELDSAVTLFDSFVSIPRSYFGPAQRP